jgi:N-acetylglucosamine-6-phosphate deacetylase
MALGNYIKVAGLERVIIVTDAISAAGLGPGVYKIADQEVIVDDHGATWSADRSHLAGSSATMPAMERLLKQALQFADEELKQLMYHNPRTAVFDAAR